ncbi:YxeA family protein [Sporosarcina sp. Te-1]|uniref:YxeA family protein n=1 Tax=Sporosarcina sp. Te-1 TaxID=2818390 RepID=UPI001A9ECF20|nr:YxeA family protein [Sporosarcina sp. Te-1]QTD40568.1 YxeA family protein [Sporosarcina sp. Te-1]
MKKGMIITVTSVVLLTGIVLVLAKIDFNRMGKDNAYYQVPAPESIEETKLDSGEIMITYWYTGSAYKENGEEINVEFFASKELRHGAYLKLYLKKGAVVTSYEEVKLPDIPDKVKF